MCQVTLHDAQESLNRFQMQHTVLQEVPKMGGIPSVIATVLASRRDGIWR